MGYYIKTRQIVHDTLGFATGDRGRSADGKYLLWQADMIRLGDQLGIPFSGRFYDYLLYVARRVGALVLTAKEAREEQDGTTNRWLPVAEDERFIDDEQRQRIAKEKAEAESYEQQPTTEAETQAEDAQEVTAETEAEEVEPTETTDGEAESHE
jgi:hypothetical protein